MKRILFISLAACLLSPSGFGQERKVLDRVVAIVGGEIITASELTLQSMQVALQNRMSPTDTTVRRRVLDAMIADKLILAQAQMDSVAVTDDEVTQALDQQLQYLERTYGSRERLEQAAGMPMSRIKREFREDIRNRLMVDRLKQQKLGDLQVSRREVEEFFAQFKDSIPTVPEQVELRQIVMFPKATTTYRTNALRKAEALLDSLKQGADFALLAKRYSEDAGSARNGGDLGLVRRGIFVKEFEEAAFALEPGQTSGIVETQFGFHIIKLLEKKGEAIHPQHILIRVSKTGESDSTVINALQALRERALHGEHFDELAKRYSEDPDTRPYGGSLGLVEVPRLSDEMHTAEQELKPGEISPPVKLKIGSDYAYSILQLVQRISPHPAALDTDYARIEEFAKFQKRTRLTQEWIEKIRPTIYCEIRL